MRASTIALQGDVLIQATGAELRSYDARTLVRTETRDLAPSHFCFARDGALVVYSYPPGGASTLYRIGASRNLETFGGLLLVRSSRSVLLPGPTAAQFYVVGDEAIATLDIVGGKVEEGPELARPAPTLDNRDQLFARDDGSIVAPNGEPGLRVVSPDGNGVSYSMKGRAPLHLRAASGGRVWYTHVPVADRGATQLYLAPITSPLSEEHGADLSPLRISHLASGKGVAAVLGAELRGPDDVRWALIVFGEDGKERWRAVPPPAMTRTLTGASGHLAVGDKRVVFSSHDSALFGWDAATGKPIA